MTKIGSIDMFSIPKGTTLKTEGGKVITLLSDYKIDGLGYEYSSEGETGFIACIELFNAVIIE